MIKEVNKKMIMMLVNKISRDIFMGEGDYNEAEEMALTKVVQVNFMELQERGRFVSVPNDYLPFGESMFTAETMAKRFEEITFETKHFHVFTEDEIRKEMIDWHRQAMAQKSGIEIVGADSQIIH